MTNEEMDEATYGLKTKADKIRKLDELGIERARIAAYLNIRYRHVRNVLVAPQPSRRLAASRATPGDLESGNKPVRPLSIEEAKRGLAAQFGVSPDSIEIVIRG